MKILKTRRMFNAEFKNERVQLIKQGKLSVPQISKTHKISSALVYKWSVK